jgi:hypothetical protein
LRWNLGSSGRSREQLSSWDQACILRTAECSCMTGTHHA